MSKSVSFRFSLRSLRLCVRFIGDATEVPEKIFSKGCHRCWRAAYRGVDVGAIPIPDFKVSSRVNRKTKADPILAGRLSFFSFVVRWLGGNIVKPCRTCRSCRVWSLELRVWGFKVWRGKLLWWERAGKRGFDPGENIFKIFHITPLTLKPRYEIIRAFSSTKRLSDAKSGA